MSVAPAEAHQDRMEINHLQNSSVTLHRLESVQELEFALDDDEPKHEWEEKTHKCCCCFSTKRSCIRTCLPILVALALALGLLVFFLFPRIPSVFLLI
jgi:hypothetical protein